MSKFTWEELEQRLVGIQLEIESMRILISSLDSVAENAVVEVEVLREDVKKAKEDEMDPNKLTLEEVQAWAASPLRLELGVESPEVTTFEKLCKRFAEDLYTGTLDEKFGKGCRSAATQYQEYRLLQPEDGIVGPATKADMRAAFEAEWTLGQPFQPPWPIQQNVLGPRHPDLGFIPSRELGKAEEGRMSTFGGPHDYGDRIYGQAYLSTYDSPAAMLEKRQDLVAMGILMTEEQAISVRYKENDKYAEKRGELFFENDLSKWPITYGLGKYTAAGGSSMLNEDSFYIAMRFRGGMGRYNANNPKILLWCAETGKACVVMRTDYGPHQDTGRDVDISPGASYALGEDGNKLPTDSRVFFTWAPDDAPLGPVARLDEMED